MTVWLKKNRGALALCAAAILVLAVAGLVTLERIIDREVAATADRARDRFSGDRTAALVRLVDCEQCTLKERNRAVWALGQIGHESALPVLRKHHTGGECDHTSRLCQYELDKAIRKIDGTHSVLQTSLTKWIR
jgi:hypothetical protein